MTLGASPNSFLYAASGGGWTGMLALLKQGLREEYLAIVIIRPDRPYLTIVDLLGLIYSATGISRALK
jgi:hypothetical protein